MLIITPFGIKCVSKKLKIINIIDKLRKVIGKRIGIFLIKRFSQSITNPSVSHSFPINSSTA